MGKQIDCNWYILLMFVNKLDTMPQPSQSVTRSFWPRFGKSGLILGFIKNRFGFLLDNFLIIKVK
ncbi:MAG: hypothetical protein DRR08_08080 [Candidatus Parabeggiatoa sp. nov. 2]|nr:MAG: hypothetical protein B6247_13305 [Beggiatoa sp. 4572_84]RKZ61655.1 MAG: hypothetical protein DRR08_08080 [Gammaproteobacteria bacterium]